MKPLDITTPKVASLSPVLENGGHSSRDNGEFYKPKLKKKHGNSSNPQRSLDVYDQLLVSKAKHIDMEI